MVRFAAFRAFAMAAPSSPRILTGADFSDKIGFVS